MKSAPPPSPSPGMQAERSRSKSRTDLMTSVRFTYDDDFAPSSATLSASEPAHVLTKRGRFIFYNQHLISEGEQVGLLEELMAEAEALGCLRFPTPSALGWIKVNDQYYELAYERCGQLVEDYAEGSEQWLILNCYFHVMRATQDFSIGRPSGFIGEQMLLVGAAVRELELVRRNKQDALTRRKQKRSLVENNEGRDEHNRERQQAANEWQALAVEIAKESAASGTTRATWVAKQLKKRHGISRTAKTVGNFLAK